MLTLIKHEHLPLNVKQYHFLKKSFSYSQGILLVLLVLLIGAIFFRSSIFREAVFLNISAVRLNILFDNAPSVGMPNLFSNEAEKIENSLNLWVIHEPTNPRIWQKLALLNTWRGDVVKASGQWEKTDETLKDIITRGLNTDTINNQLNPNIWYEIGLRIDPEIRDLWFYQGIFYREQNQTEMAIDALKNSLQASDSYEIGIGDVYLQLAEIYNNNSMSEDALDYLEKALKANDFKDKEQTILQAHYLRAEIFHRLGQQTQALEEYSIVLSLQENHYWALTRTGQLIWILNGDADQAIEFIEQAITINGRPVMAYKVLGNIYCDIGSTGKAISMYQEVLLRDPRDPVALKAVNESLCSREN